MVVTHEAKPELADCIAALSAQVDELVVVTNVPYPGLVVPPGAKVVAPPRPQGFAANANLGIAATTAPYIALVNPDAVAAPDAVAVLAEVLDARPDAGVAGPRLLNVDGTTQRSNRRFPTVWGTLVRRTPLRAIVPDRLHAAAHLRLDEQPRDVVEAEWMLGAFLVLRRTMLDELGGFDERFRLYGEEIELCYRAAKAGWTRLYVPTVTARHTFAAVTDRRFLTRYTLWHARGVARFVRRHPERLRVLW